MAHNVIFGARMSIIKDREKAEQGIAYLEPNGWEVDDIKGEALRMTVLPIFQAELGKDWDIVVSRSHPGVITLFYSGDDVVNKRTRAKRTLFAADAFLAVYRKHKGKARARLEEAERKLIARQQKADHLAREAAIFAQASARENHDFQS